MQRMSSNDQKTTAIYSSATPCTPYSTVSGPLKLPPSVNTLHTLLQCLGPLSLPPFVNILHTLLHCLGPLKLPPFVDTLHTLLHCLWSTQPSTLRGHPAHLTALSLVHSAFHPPWTPCTPYCTVSGPLSLPPSMDTLHTLLHCLWSTQPSTLCEHPA